MTSASRFALVAALALVAIPMASCSNGSGVLPAQAGMQQRAAYPSPLAQELVKIKEFSDLPSYQGYYGPDSIASGPKKSLWVTDDVDQDYGECAVVQIATSGKALNTFYYTGLSSGGSSLGGLTEGPDGNLWIPDYYNWQILKMTPQGAFTGYPMSFRAPVDIVTGPDKALWFTAHDGGSDSFIGRITIKGKITLYDASGWVYGIAAGSDGALWYTETTGNAIGRITTKGKVTEYSKGISTGATPLNIAAGPDGALWFTESTGGKIGRITTAGKITEYSRGVKTPEEPYGIAAGPDGAMWFTETEVYDSYHYTGAKIGRITMSGKITTYSKNLSSTSFPSVITAGPDGNMWFVESDADRTGRVTL